MKKTKNGVPINPKTGKAETGRPSVMTPDVILKLEEAFARDASDLEACFHAGISKTPFYNYQNAHPEFKERKELLRAGVTLAVRNTVLDGIVGRPARLNARGKTIRKELPPNPDLGLKWLERRKKDEFSTRVESTGKDGQALNPPNPYAKMTLEELRAERAKRSGTK